MVEHYAGACARVIIIYLSEGKAELSNTPLPFTSIVLLIVCPLHTHDWYMSVSVDVMTT